MRAHRETPEQGGFTLIEIMVSMALLVIGLLGILALQMTTVKGNRLSRELERAKVYAAQLMEDLRSEDLSTLPASGTRPDITTSDGVTYQREYSVTTVTATMRLITTKATFAEADDPDDLHSATLQMLRTVPERM
jgi:prepilin-type N-terminal cleavage/methylation domain-containing protein